MKYHIVKGDRNITHAIAKERKIGLVTSCFETAFSNTLLKER